MFTTKTPEALASLSDLLNFRLIEAGQQPRPRTGIAFNQRLRIQEHRQTRQRIACSFEKSFDTAVGSVGSTAIYNPSLGLSATT